MERTKLCLLLAASVLLVSRTEAMPNGPPAAACANLFPQHATVGQTSPAPVSLSGLTTTYTPGDVMDFSISSSGQFRGFMIQARETEFGDPLGTFIMLPDGKQKLMACSADDDTIVHANPTDVSSVSVRWTAEDISTEITSFSFYYTVVQNTSTFWIRLHPDEEVGVVHPVAPGDINYPLVKAHGALMVLAWGLFAPVGILLALFYKVVWPNGEWFYSHIAIMVATLVGTLLGIIVIVVHAQGLWLSTTEANLPHQIIGILVVITVCLNPFMAIVRCNPSSQWRFLFNWIHGTTGLVLGQVLALAAMLLGLNVFKDLPGVYRDRVHVAVYLMSAITGLIFIILAVYNFYAIMFQKYFPSGPDDLATQSEAPGGVIPDKPLYSTDYTSEEELETSRDYWVRAGVGIVIIATLVLLVLAAIVLMALA